MQGHRLEHSEYAKYMHKYADISCMKYAFDMQKICIKYGHYIDFNIANMQII